MENNEQMNAEETKVEETKVEETKEPEKKYKNMSLFMQTFLPPPRKLSKSSSLTMRLSFSSLKHLRLSALASVADSSDFSIWRSLRSDLSVSSTLI